MDYNAFDMEEIDLYNEYIKYTNKHIKKELNVGSNKNIEITNINREVTIDEWIFTVIRYSYRDDGMSKSFKKYLKCSSHDEIKELMPLESSLHTVKALSYNKWRLMIKRDYILKTLLKENPPNQ